MELAFITHTTYLAAAFFFAVLGLVYSWQVSKHIVHWSLATACLANSGFLLAEGLYGDWPSGHPQFALAAELLRYLVWIFAIVATLKFLTTDKLPNNLGRTIYASALFSFFVIAWNFRTLENSEDLAYTLSWAGLLLSIASLICLEQLYKNIDQNRQIRLLCLCLGATFIYDIYLFSHSLTYSGLDPQLWQSRAVIAVATASVMIVGALTLNPQNSASSKLSLSRPIVFYSTSITASGLFITVLGAGGFYVREIGGNWGTVLYTLFLFGTLMGIAILFVSSTARNFLSVLINKHFFSHKYDYRTEWLKLIKTLSLPTLPGQVNERAFNTIRDIVKSPGGALWLLNDNQYTLHHQEGIALEFPYPNEPARSDFCTILRKQEWVFIPNSKDDNSASRFNEHLPDWLRSLPDVWLVLPLLSEHDLHGFIVLAQSKVDPSLTWEDRDLLKTIGRQVSSYLKRHEQAQRITESSQFDTFNRLSAFIMHDLKNLIAQQALVVKNAAKHKDNPAFIEDAINTIDNSVNRMSGLLKKLQPDEPSEIRAHTLKEILLEATRKCQIKKPTPALRLNGNNGTINADKDRLVMAITHLINNAQDATPNNGFIDVNLKIKSGVADIIIEDNGSGMNEHFINTRLFKPFDSTKEGKGMGIGVYQAKEIASELMGTLNVVSIPKEGSTFTMHLPLVRKV